MNDTLNLLNDAGASGKKTYNFLYDLNKDNQKACQHRNISLNI